MRKLWLAIAITAALAFGIWLLRPASKNPKADEKLSAKTEAQGYWTCPMHPQIHSEHPGECPICHMKLIQVKAQGAQTSGRGQGENRVPVQATPSQQALIGIQKTTVEKMDLKIKIPVAGRFISSSTVAFQIYESDLRYIKPGLPFHGASSFHPEEEVNGVISSVDSIVDPTSRTVRVLGSVGKGKQNEASETGFRGEIETDLKDRVAIPESAVVHTGADDLVYVFSNGNELTPKIVRLGIKSEEFYDVLDGLQAGESISSGPNFLIDSESRIRGVSINTPMEKRPSCPKGQHWDVSMSMCMPGEG
jgi:hypothetical protein